MRILRIIPTIKNNVRSITLAAGTAVGSLTSGCVHLEANLPPPPPPQVIYRMPPPPQQIIILPAQPQIIEVIPPPPPVLIVPVPCPPRYIHRMPPPPIHHNHGPYRNFGPHPNPHRR